MKLPNIKVTLQAGPHSLSFTIDKVIVKSRNLLGRTVIDIQQLIGESSVKIVLGREVEQDHSPAQAKATVINKESNDD